MKNSLTKLGRFTAPCMLSMLANRYIYYLSYDLNQLSVSVYLKNKLWCTVTIICRTRYKICKLMKERSPSITNPYFLWACWHGNMSWNFKYTVTLFGTTLNGHGYTSLKFLNKFSQKMLPQRLLNHFKQTLLTLEEYILCLIVGRQAQQLQWKNTRTWVSKKNDVSEVIVKYDMWSQVFNKFTLS